MVAELVARLTNRHIAETLFLSRRTVDRHVSGVMRKLDVGSRTAVAVRLLEGRTDPTYAFSRTLGDIPTR